MIPVIDLTFTRTTWNGAYVYAQEWKRQHGQPSVVEVHYVTPLGDRETLRVGP